MDRLAAAAATAASLPEKTTTTSGGFVSWDEDFVSRDKGKREVHYYLKRRDGSSDLAVIGKEKSLRHMSYHYALSNRVLHSLGLFSLLPKLKSRREVVDWLNSIASDSQPSDRLMDTEDADAGQPNIESLQDVPQIKLGQHTRDFSWLGCPWTCRRKRRHYPSFSRNGVKISVHDFIYVLAEEGKRLVAYLEDMFEDSRSSKMVVVRWFHKIDEVDIVLPQKFNEREIFFSLCLQDLSIECIDGLATVLSPHHFQKFQDEAKHTRLEPFVCEKQFENDDIKPFDITQVKGYWKQEILRYMYGASKSHGHTQQSDDDNIVEENANSSGMRPRKRLRWSKYDESRSADKRQLAHASCHDTPSLGNNLVDKRDVFCEKGGPSSSPRKELISSCPLTIGSEIEVLSQSSGIRGCWFRALIIKKCKDKVKVQYHDLQDVDEESNKLAEWISAAQVAAPDQLGLRTNGRLIIRPLPQSSKDCSACDYNVGTVVDAWWHDGWWEGIVVHKGLDDKLRVYFPGEMQESVFSPGNLRHSQEWVGTDWIHMQERPDIATSILSPFENKGLNDKSPSRNSSQLAICDSKQSGKDGIQPSESCRNSGVDKVKESCMVPDLSKDDLLAKLRWQSSKKRSLGGNALPKHHFADWSKSFSDPLASSPCENFLISAAMKVDHDNCKFLGDSLFTSSVVPTLSSLVMSR